MRSRFWLRMWAVMATAIVATVAAVSSGTAANAANDVGSGTVYVGPAPSQYVKSNGYAQWDKYTHVVVLKATGYGMYGNNCMTTWFDWNVDASWPNSEHFDARAIRQCQINYNGTDTFTIPEAHTAGQNYWFVGVQKFAACYGANNTANGCADSSQATIPLGTVNPVFDGNNWVTKWSVRNANGSASYGSGGNPRSSSS